MNVENLTKLYEVGRKILRERLPLMFGMVECGSFACLSGWYGREYGLTPSYAMFNVEYHFGVTSTAGDQLFCCAAYINGLDPESEGHPADEPGPAAYAELEKRMDYLANLIREAGGTVPGEHTGLPDVARDLFRIGEAA